jgi:hypothetical protein
MGAGRQRLGLGIRCFLSRIVSLGLLRSKDMTQVGTCLHAGKTCPGVECEAVYQSTDKTADD